MNPSTSKVTSSNGTRLPNNVNSNNPRAFNSQGYNTFDRRVPHAMTLRVGDITPFYDVPEIEGNNARVSTFHHLRSETINSALFSKIRLDKSFYQVPWSAIQPSTWKLLYRQPLGTSDIDFVQSVQGVHLNKVNKFVIQYTKTVRERSDTYNYTVQQLMQGLFAISQFIVLFDSNSSVLKYLGISTPNEDFGDRFLSKITRLFTTPFIGGKISFNDYAGVTHVYNLPSPDDYSSDFPDDVRQGYLSRFFAFVDDFRFYASGGLSAYGYSYPSDLPQDAITSRGTTAEGIAAFESAYPLLAEVFNSMLTDYHQDVLNYDPTVNDYDHICFHLPVAYQLICHQYFSNSNVDDIYSASDFLDNFRALCFDVSYSILNHPFSAVAQRLQNSNRTVSPSVGVDGVSVPRDAFATVFNDYVLDSTWNAQVNLYSSTALTYLLSTYSYFASLLVLNRSLREGDYFTSGRTRPLATGDVTIYANNNRILAWDVNKSLWIQRFRNAVNRLPQSIYEYIRGLTGVSPERIEPQPNFIVSEHYNISGFQIENTSEDQGKLVTLFNDSQSSFNYECFVDEPSYIIGVYSFVYDTIYPKSTLKVAFLKDRFDWFNHFLQHGGDEAIMAKELSSVRAHYATSPIAYQIHYSGFKYSLPRASGAFSSGLLRNSLIMRQIDLENPISSVDGNFLPTVISSEFIRNNNTDIEPIFASFTGENLTERYHFIVYNYFDDIVNSRQAKFPGLDE